MCGMKSKAVIAVLVLHVGLLFFQAFADSPVWDEVGHFAAGLYYTEYGSFDLYNVNPPLPRIAGILLPVLAGAQLDASQHVLSPHARTEFLVGRDTIVMNKDNIRLLYLLARTATIGFSVLGGLMCYRWANELYGKNSAVFALAMWCFSPSIIAHGHLMTPDVPASAMALIAFYWLWRWLQVANSYTTVAAGLALGGALLCKMTLVVTVPIYIFGFFYKVTNDRHDLGLRLSSFLGLAFVSLLTLHSGYGFERFLEPIERSVFRSPALTGIASETDPKTGLVYFEEGNRFRGTILGKLPMPLPPNYVIGMDVQKCDFEKRFWSYLRGEWRQRGWWYYYAYAFLVKVPVGYIFAILGAVCLSVYQPHRASWFVAAPAIVIIVFVSSQTGFNHHFRYILPAMPFLFVIASKLVANESPKVARRLGAFAIVAGGLSSAFSLPYSLSYFNQAAGGWRSGGFHLGYSNVDWGQDLWRLRDWYRDSFAKTDTLYLAYDMPLVDPATFGVRYQKPPIDPRAEYYEAMAAPEITPGTYCIGVNYLRSAEHRYDYLL